MRTDGRTVPFNKNIISIAVAITVGPILIRACLVPAFLRSARLCMSLGIASNINNLDTAFFEPINIPRRACATRLSVRPLRFPRRLLRNHPRSKVWQADGRTDPLNLKDDAPHLVSKGDGRGSGGRWSAPPLLRPPHGNEETFSIQPLTSSSSHPLSSLPRWGCNGSVALSLHPWTKAFRRN